MTNPVPLMGHRGAAGWRPENTAGAFEFCALMGADWLEFDLLPTSDYELVVRHENEISLTTDVAKHPEFADRKTTKTVDGDEVTGWFTEDFALAELKTLGMVERVPEQRQHNTVFDGVWPIMTFQEVIDLARDLATKVPQKLSLLPEIKHPTYFRELGMPLEAKVADIVKVNGLDSADADLGLIIPSFEPTCLQKVRKLLPNTELWQAVGVEGGPWDLNSSGDPTTWADMVTAKGMRDQAKYCDWTGPYKTWIIARNPDGSTGEPTDLVEDAHKAGLKICPYTFKHENEFLPTELQVGDDPNDHGKAIAEYAPFLELGVDAVATDFPDSGYVALNPPS